MKSKEEQLKIYAAYLPYGLKIGFEGEDHECSFVGLELSNEGVMLISPFGDFGRANIENCKPILYPLEYLTKEIEHEGKIITPIEEIAKDLEMNAAEYMFLTANVESQEFDWLRTAAYPVIQKMLEYHLNVFSLPEDQFINKATLTQKQ